MKVDDELDMIAVGVAVGVYMWGWEATAIIVGGTLAVAGAMFIAGLCRGPMKTASQPSPPSKVVI
jgi:hypothetical protein